MKISKNNKERLKVIKNAIASYQRLSDLLYLRAKLILDTDDEDAYLHDYLYNNVQAKNSLEKLKKKK